MATIEPYKSGQLEITWVGVDAYIPEVGYVATKVSLEEAKAAIDRHTEEE